MVGGQPLKESALKNGLKNAAKNRRKEQGSLGRVVGVGYFIYF